MPYIRGFYYDPTEHEIVCLSSPRGYGYLRRKETGEPITDIIPGLCLDSDP